MMEYSSTFEDKRHVCTQERFSTMSEVYSHVLVHCCHLFDLSSWLFCQNGKSFKEMAGDDGTLDMDEFTELCDEFAKEQAMSSTGK